MFSSAVLQLYDLEKPGKTQSLAPVIVFLHFFFRDQAATMLKPPYQHKNASLKEDMDMDEANLTYCAL